jgi:hypothetical protein
MLAAVQRLLASRPALAVLAAVLAALLLIPRVGGQATRTVTVDVVFLPSSFSLIRAAANQQLPPTVPPSRGDVIAGQGVVYRPGQTQGERVGSAYLWLVGTTAATSEQEAAAAGNQFYGSFRLELLGQGSLDLTGTVNVFGPSDLALVGGTGAYMGARGQCVLETISHGPDVDHVVCDLR